MKIIQSTLLVFSFVLSNVAAAEGGQPETDFPADYIQEKSGRYEYLVPETFELANILLVLTDWGMADEEGNFFTNTDYHGAVMAHFEPHRQHPAVLAVQEIVRESFSDFIGFRENSTRFHFEGERLEESAFLDSWWNPGSLSDGFKANRELIEDFARVSGFREFYSRHAGTYRAQIDEYRSMVDLDAIAGWLEANFGVGFDTYQIFFSPLLRGNHSASVKFGNGFRRLAVVVASPYMARVRSVAGGDLLLLRYLFTEIDHGYVNPVTDVHSERVDTAFSRLDFWYRDPEGFYATPYKSFNEYMTWGAMALFIRDHYPAVRYKLAREEIVRYMNRSRGFIAFQGFMDELERLTASRPEKPLAEMYPELLDWAETFQEMK